MSGEAEADKPELADAGPGEDTPRFVSLQMFSTDQFGIFEGFAKQVRGSTESEVLTYDPVNVRFHVSGLQATVVL